MWRASPTSRTTSTPFISRFLLDEETFQIRRVEVEGRANFDRWQLTALYGNYDAQPEIGFLERRQGVTGQVTFKFTQNWSVLASARYDLEAEQDQPDTASGSAISTTALPFRSTT